MLNFKSHLFFFLFLNSKLCRYIFLELNGGGRKGIERRKKWLKKSWEEGEMAQKKLRGGRNRGKK